MPIMPEMVYNIISIHALREEGDPQLRAAPAARWRLFLSTPSARRATYRLL